MPVKVETPLYQLSPELLSQWLFSDYCTNRQYTFQCMHQDRCISRSLVCDGYDNCGDSADEHTCPGKVIAAYISGVMRIKLCDGQLIIFKLYQYFRQSDPLS